LSRPPAPPDLHSFPTRRSSDLGLPPVASKCHIWVARPTPIEVCQEQTLPVDWCGITQRGETATNYQILPGDRIYVQSNPLVRAEDRKSTRLNSSHDQISYAVFC